MKSFDWIRLTVVNTVWILLILLPFLPGPPNKLVIGLSVLSQSAGFFGLVLVPVGIAWIISDKIVKRKNGTRSRSNFSYFLAIIAALLMAVIYLLLTLALFTTEGILAALAMLLPVALLSRPVIKVLRNIKDGSRLFHPMAFYLLTVPLVAFMARVYLVNPLSEHSRNLAIQKSQPLISAIETYKNKEGQYPASLSDLEGRYLKNIPGSSVMGILDFRYHKINEQYSLSFSQWLDIGSLEEIVLYDRSNLHKKINAFSKYHYSLDLHRVNGAFAVLNTRYDNWRYYHCD